MVDLSTRYMGITIQSPIIAGSSGLTGRLESLLELERNGVGAVVLKSIFEEEILNEHQVHLGSLDSFQSELEYLDYYDYKLREEKVGNYLQLIEKAKKKLNIPIIASVNCISAHEWKAFAKSIASAGADALEINAMLLPADLKKSPDDMEALYDQIIHKVVSSVNIPVAFKISPYFMSLANSALRFSKSGISSLVMFNRTYNPDIDIYEQSITHSNILSNPIDLLNTLRWTAILANRINCDISASGGVSDAASVIKLLLAGAQTVQVASTLYKNNVQYVNELHNEIGRWMSRFEYTNIEQFRGKLSYNQTENAAQFERVQFMKYFGEYNHE